MQETGVRSLGWEDPLEKEMAAHSSILAWKIPWMVEPGGLLSMVLVVLVIQLCLILCNPMDCSLPGSSVHGILQAGTLEWVAISFSNFLGYKNVLNIV